MNALEVVREAERELGAAGVPEPRTDAELLVAHVLGRRRSELYSGGCELDDGARRRLRPLLDRRSAREPLQYVLGEWGFRRLTLTLDHRVLVPRPETETLVERCLELLRDHAKPRVLDVGVGSGAITLALADEHPGARVTGVDASTDAIAVARENARRAGLAAKVELVAGDVLGGLDGPYDLVVSNPPYVDADRVETLDPEIRDWEPRSALVASGLTEALAREAPRVLRPGGWLALECGDGQAAAVAALLRSFGYEEISVTRDLGGTERVVDGRLTP